MKLVSPYSLGSQLSCYVLFVEICQVVKEILKEM